MNRSDAEVDMELGLPAAADLPPLAEPQHDLLLRQKAVVAMGRRAVAPPDLAILLQDAAALLAEMLGTEYGGVAELSADGKSLFLTLRQAGSENAAPSTLVHQSLAAGTESLASYVVQVAHPVVVDDLPRESRFLDLFLRKQGIRSALAVPLTLRDRSFGALAACTCKARHFEDDDVLFVEAIAHLVATTIGRNQAEVQLTQERRLAAEVLQTIDALVLMLDSQWQIVRMNPACERLTGFALHEVRNRPIWNVFAVPEEAEAFRKALEKLPSRASAVSCESHLLTKHSERLHIAWSCRAMIDRGGRLETVIASGIDITGRRQAEEKARRMERVFDEARRASPDPGRSQIGTFGVLPDPTHADRRKRPRRSYPYTQMVAFFVKGKLPAPNDFFAARCNDIAAGGFSFLCPVPPPADALVVALGTPPKVAYLTAQVAHVTRTEQDGKRMFLVGCNYTGRAAF